jgi:hypothetical protein
MSDIFKEIEQEIRRDDALELWRKYQIPVYALAVLIVIGVAAWRYWDYRREQAAQARGGRYEAALQLGRDGKTAQAIAALKSMVGDPGGYGLLARFSVADAQAATDPKGAAAAYDAIARDAATPPAMRNLARLRAALIYADDADSKEAERRLQDLAGPSDPFHASAREQLAVLALKRQDTAAAGRWLDMIVSDPTSPPAVRARAESLEGLVSGAAPKQPAAPAPKQPAAPASKAPAAPASKAPASKPPAVAPASPAPSQP